MKPTIICTVVIILFTFALVWKLYLNVDVDIPTTYPYPDFKIGDQTVTHNTITYYKANHEKRWKLLLNK